MVLWIFTVLNDGSNCQCASIFRVAYSIDNVTLLTFVFYVFLTKHRVQIANNTSVNSKHRANNLIHLQKISKFYILRCS